ncbi:hypothetical protein GCK32_022148 [Trichostrongylus colubriformis]|uniref:Uncharacterized protein n=1 Tax=Trichostrongylus colubriformis TaxID=6319 RepID=A0AAN8FRW4_TRICO
MCKRTMSLPKSYSDQEHRKETAPTNHIWKMM